MVDTEDMTPIENILSERLQEARELEGLAKVAHDYLLMHSWCKSIKQGYLYWGVNELFAIFYFEIEPAHSAQERSGWVIVGDVPPAYIDDQHCEDALSALEVYIHAMSKWVEYVRSGKSVEELVPVTHRNSRRLLEPTLENAEIVDVRMKKIEKSILPDIKWRVGN